jgi:hypothetical protein
MSDITCRKCGEPWEYLYLRHEAGFEDPGPHAPATVRKAYDGFARASKRADRTHGTSAYEDAELAEQNAGRNTSKRVYEAVASGQGCPSCWFDPSRIPTDPTAREQIEVEGLHSLFDGTDDDPASFLEAHAPAGGVA